MSVREHRISAPSLEALAIQARLERIRIRPTMLYVQPALYHLAREVLLRAEATGAPLWRLRYRWSLRHRAPAWKQAKCRRRYSAATRGLRESMRHSLPIVAARVLADRHAADILNNGFTV